MAHEQFGLPAWAYPPSLQHRRRDPLPRPPFFDVLAGATPRAFNPGARFGPGGLVFPSQQRFNRLVPSEQQAYGGYLSDELGVDPNDVFALMQRLRPRGAISATPRWLFF